MRFARILLAVAGVVVVLPASALAVHPRPGGGTPFRVPLVPAYDQCTIAAQNSNHVAPLALDSCSPPDERSPIVTRGTAGAANGTMRMTVFCTNGAAPPCAAQTGDQEDIRWTYSDADVRCKAVTPNCSAVGADYTGSVIVSTRLRLTDHANSSDPTAGAACTNGGGNAPCITATMVDIEFALPGSCIATPASPNGSLCSLSATLDAQIPGMNKESQRVVMSAFQAEVREAGPNGDIGPACPPFCGTGDENVFATQGIFLP
jgi:hypothetical protein